MNPEPVEALQRSGGFWGLGCEFRIGVNSFTVRVRASSLSKYTEAVELCASAILDKNKLRICLMLWEALGGWGVNLKCESSRVHPQQHRTSSLRRLPICD